MRKWGIWRHSSKYTGWICDHHGDLYVYDNYAVAVAQAEMFKSTANPDYRYEIREFVEEK